MMSEAEKLFRAPDSKGQTTYTMDDISSVKNINSLRKNHANPFNLKECDAGFTHPEQHAIMEASTTRTEMSTDLDDCSVQQRFSFASTSLNNANGGPSDSYAMSFESNAAKCPSTTGRRIVDVIDTSGSYEMVSQLTGPKTSCLNAYGGSLLDLDEEDAFDSPRHCSSWGESMFIGTNDALDTESRMNFYTVPDAMKDMVGTKAVRERLQTMQSPGSMFIPSDGALDTESRFGFYKQESLVVASNRSMSVATDSRDDFNIVNDAEEPPSCRDKMGPVLSFNDEDEFDWLTQTTMKIESKKKDEKSPIMKCGDNGGVASNLRNFVSRCGSCFSPP